MTALARLEFYQGELKFSAGHFTIFSKTHREYLHGHNYTLQAQVDAAMQEPGLSFDYNLFKQKILKLCSQLHSRFLLAGSSPYLQIEEQESYYYAHFNNEAIPFLKKDVVILPLNNITLEELAKWFVMQIVQDNEFINGQHIHAITIKVFNGPEQSASFSWNV